MRGRHKRIERVADAIDASPVRRHLLREAYEWFTGFGELPDDDHVAFEVVQQALRGGEDAPLEDEALIAGRVRKARIAYHKKDRPGDSWPPSVRAFLFDEALFEVPPLRKVARGAIAAEVAWGGDVENLAFGARHGIPGYGKVAMHMLGWPAKLAVPPFEDQAKRLFVRQDNLRGRIEQDNPDWFDAEAKALAAFWQNGELPGDELLLEGVLVNVELDLLQGHRRGKDVSKAMHLLDQAARSTDETLQGCLAELSELAKAGRLFVVRTDVGRRSRQPRRTPPAP